MRVTFATIVLALFVCVGVQASISFVPTECGVGGTYQSTLRDGLSFWAPFEGNFSSSPRLSSDSLVASSSAPPFVAGVSGQGVRFQSTQATSSFLYSDVGPGAHAPNLRMDQFISPVTGEDIYKATYSMFVKVDDFTATMKTAPSCGTEGSGDFFMPFLPFFCTQDGYGVNRNAPGRPGLCVGLGKFSAGTLLRPMMRFNNGVPVVNSSPGAGESVAAFQGWTHVALTLDITGGGTSVAYAYYVNGTVKSSGTSNFLNSAPFQVVVGQGSYANTPSSTTCPYPATSSVQSTSWVGGNTAVYSAYTSDFSMDEFAFFTRVLSTSEINELASNPSALYNAHFAGACSCQSNHFINATQQCEECASACETCSGSATTCDTCAAGFAGPPSCSFVCNARCGSCPVGQPDQCDTCATGFTNPPICQAECQAQCETCAVDDGASCVTCAPGFTNPPACSDTAAISTGAAPADSGSGVALYAGVGAGVAVLLLIAIVVIVVVRSRSGANIDFEAMLPPPPGGAGWVRLFPRWNEPKFDFAGSSGMGAGGTYAPMEGVIASEPLALPLFVALFEVVPKRTLYSAVVSAMATTEPDGTTLPLLKMLISHEIGSTLSAETLFRQNSAATKMFQAWGKIRAIEYVRKIIGVLVLECLYQYEQVHGKRQPGSNGDVELDDGFTSTSQGLEVDPSRLTDADSLDVNKYKLMTTCQTFLESIYRSSSRCPQSLKDVLAYVGSAVGEAYPGRSIQGMGGFFFLRLFCPALTSPQEYQISRDEVSRDERRYLVLVAKVIQNAANGVKFGAKESFMVQLNDLVESNIPKIDNFFSNALFAGSDAEAGTFTGPEDVDEPVPPMVRANALATLHTMVVENSDQILSWLDQNPMDGADIARMQVAAIMALAEPPGDPAPKAK